LSFVGFRRARALVKKSVLVLLNEKKSFHVHIECVYLRCTKKDNENRSLLKQKNKIKNIVIKKNISTITKTPNLYIGNIFVLFFRWINIEK
jgi:hypothetical protein